MRLICVALILPYYVLGQVYDNFSDGDFTNNPNWFGLKNHFEIDSEYRLYRQCCSKYHKHRGSKYKSDCNRI